MRHPAEITAMERVWVLFDGNDTARLQAARAQWKAMTGAGHAAQYLSLIHISEPTRPY